MEAASRSTETVCARPTRARQTSAAASPAAPSATWAARPTLKREGRPGPSPLNSIRSTAAGSPSSAAQTGRKAAVVSVVAVYRRVAAAERAQDIDTNTAGEGNVCSYVLFDGDRVVAAHTIADDVGNARVQLLASLGVN